MKQIKFLILVIILTVFQFDTSFANTVELQDWKEGLKECAKDSEGFWIDIMVDESSSMNSNDPLNQSFKASYALIEEVEGKLDDFNNLDKSVYLNLYAFSGKINDIYSTGKPVTKSELREVPNLQWTYTGDGTRIDLPFAQLLMNTIGTNQVVNSNDLQYFSTPELDVSSRDLSLCHVGLVITDAEVAEGYTGYKTWVDNFLSYENNFLLVGHIGVEDKYFTSLKNIVYQENGLAIKIDDMNNIFLLWEEVIDILDANEDTEGEVKVAENVKVEICDENTVVTSNNNCSYTLSLEAFAEKYTLFGGVRDQSKQPSNLDGLVLRITGPNSNKGTDISLSNREETTKDIQGVSFTVDPGRSKFKISLSPTSKEFRDFVGDWTFQIYSKNNNNNRYVLIDEKIYGELKAYLAGPASSTPFIEACYDLKLEKLNDGSVFNEADFEVNNVEFRLQNQNGGELLGVATVEKNGLQYCFTFNEKISNSTVYIKPKVSIKVNSAAGEFDFNTSTQETKVEVGFIPEGIEVKNFDNNLLRSSASLGEVTISQSGAENYLLKTEAENSTIFLDCSTEWKPVEADTTKPNYGFILNLNDQEIGCGEELTIQNPGTYEFNFVLDIQEIFEGKGDLKLDISIFDTTYGNDELVGKAQFIQPIYFVPFSSKILWVLIVMISVIAGAFGMNTLLSQSQKGFTFPTNKQAINLVINKDSTLEEFSNELKNTDPINLPTGKLKSKEINGIKFSSHSGMNNTNKIFLNSSGPVYLGSNSDPSKHLLKNDFNLETLILYSIENQEEVRLVLFLNTSTQIEELEIDTLYESITTKFQNKKDEENDDKKDDIFTDNDLDEEEVVDDIDFSDDDFSDDDF